MPTALAAAGDANDTGSPSSSMRPSSGCDDAGHDLDQRRFSGAVLAEHRMDATGFDHQVGILQRAHAAIALGNALHDEQAHYEPTLAAGCQRGAA